MQASSREFSEESFTEVLKHLERLRPLAELALKFHTTGITRNELKHLMGLLEEAIVHSTGRTDLPILSTLNWFQQNVDRFLPTDIFFTIKRFKDVLPADPLFLPVHTLRSIICGSVVPPPPPTLRELVDEFDALIEGFTSELMRHTKLLVEFFKVATPTSIPWIVKLIEDNPGIVRSSLGEPLCIWWVSRVLSESKPIWKIARGPFKMENVEVDVVSVHSKEFAVAEVKVSRPPSDKLFEGCEQVAEAAKMFMNPNTLKRIFTWLREPCNPSEVALVTPYSLKGHKAELESRLVRSLEEKGINEVSASVYDINDILATIRTWKSEAKQRYEELFITLNKILETT
ncbi:MAG: hypothetical protein QW158_08345 [Nitrososphaerales archaeon]